MGWWEKAEMVEGEESGPSGAPKALALMVVLTLPSVVAWIELVRWLFG